MRRGVFASSLLVVSTVVATAHAQDNSAFAQRRFAQGVRLFDAHRYADALTEFEASVALYASPNSRLYIGRCLRELGRVDEAAMAFETAAADADDRSQRDPRYRETRDVARAELQRIEPRIARVTIRITPLPSDARVLVGTRAIPTAALGLPIAVVPGHVTVSVDAPGYEHTTREVEARAGAASSLDLTLVRSAPTVVSSAAPIASPQPSHDARAIAPAASPLVPLGWTAVGVGVVSLASAGVFAYLGDQQFQHLVSTCGGVQYCAGSDADANTGRTYQLLNNITLGVGIGLVAIGAVLLVVERARRPSTSTARSPSHGVVYEVRF